MADNILILGAGLAGLSAAYHLSADYEIYEKESEAGGLCRSYHINGFTFDHALHVLYSENEYVNALIRKLLPEALSSHTRSSWIYSKGVLTPYPFQVNTFGLPVEVVKECVLGFIEAKYSSNGRTCADNFEDWIYTTFGSGIARHFMIPFNRKLWACDLKEISTEWIERRIPRPGLEEVLDGALRRQERQFGLNAQFYYPSEGGIGSISRAFLPHISNLHLNRQVTAILLEEQRIILDNVDSRRYNKVISSLPLPRLVEMADSVPVRVEEAARKLKYNKVYSISMGVSRARISDAHWIYFPEPEFIFHRVSFPMNFSPSMAPNGASSITAEVSASPNKDVDEQGLLQRVIDDLVLADILREDDEILTTSLLRLEPAYIIYRHEHRENVNIIHEFLESKGVYPCGRFGMWEYYNQDCAILSGKAAAEKCMA